MYYNSLHNKWLRMLTAILGTGVMGTALNLFIVPLHLYTGGVMGMCQLIRTLLVENLGLYFGERDIAGLLYFLFNAPLLAMGYRTLGRGLTVRMLVTIASYTAFTSVIPIPAEPIVDDYLTACLLGGILNGTGSGLVLTCGGSTGGLDIIGLTLSKRGGAFSVGRISIAFNGVLYGICLLLFTPEVAIYSVIYNFTSNLVLDRMHQQNVSVQALIFTHESGDGLSRFIMDTLHRGVTCWEGVGAYTGQGVHVLCVTLSQYEIDELRRAVRHYDPHAFMTVQRGVHVYGNYHRRVG